MTNPFVVIFVIIALTAISVEVFIRTIPTTPKHDDEKRTQSIVMERPDAAMVIQLRSKGYIVVPPKLDVLHTGNDDVGDEVWMVRLHHRDIVAIPKVMLGNLKDSYDDVSQWQHQHEQESRRQ